MGTRRVMIAWSAAGALLLTGCTAPGTTGGAASPASSSVSPAGTPASETLSDFEQQLPLRGSFVSQWAETTGSVLIERRPDGTTWAVLSGFSTGDASDLRLHLKEGALEQDSTGAWVDTAGYSFEIAQLSPTVPDMEVEIPGAHVMPTIRTLTVTDYTGPDYPSLGSAALAG